MCGFVGLIGEKVNKEKFNYARDLIKHRGPDDADSFFCDKNLVNLGHRRMSIIDLTSAGRQPMDSNDNNLIIVYNGEIYNYLELKKELKGFYKFKTKTDTEVILASYLKWGKKCLDKFNGMFAFAIYDRRKNELFIARDRLGIKPFYYYLDNNKIIISSEIKPIFSLGAAAEPNNKIIFHYLSQSIYDHGEETFFNCIFRLLPGHFGCYKNKKMTIIKYWDLTEATFDYGDTLEENKEIFLALLKDSIKLRFRSDVPVGLNLSSGLDSSTIYYIAKKLAGYRINLFTSCFLDKQFDEGDIIEQTLSPEDKKNWHRAYFNPKTAFKYIERMNEIQEEPYGGLSTISYSQVYQQIKSNNVKVLLEGQGADEELAGYPYYIVEHIKDLIKSNNAADFKKAINCYSKVLGKENAIKKMKEFKEFSLNNLSQDFTQESNSEIIKQSLNQQYSGKKIILPLPPFKSNLLNAQYLDIKYKKLPRVLRFNDKISMSIGAELRMPYLDHRVVEFSFFLPAKHKINFSQQKCLLREAAKEVMPKKVFNRSKVIYGASQPEWFKKYFRENIYDIINSRSFKNRPYWDYKKAKIAVDDFFYNDRANGFHIWQLINLEIWSKRFLDNN